MPSEIIYLLSGISVGVCGFYFFTKWRSGHFHELANGGNPSTRTSEEALKGDDELGNSLFPLERISQKTVENDAEKPVGVRFGEDLENPLFEVELHERNTDVRGKSIKNPSQLGFLEPVLQRLPDLLRLGSEAMWLVYRVKFSPEITKGLLNGTLKLMGEGTRAEAVTATGSPLIKGSAEVISSAGNPVTLGLLAWQIAAVVTAQRFLAEIDDKLREVEHGLEGIQHLLKDTMKNTLSANIVQLRDMSFRLQNGKVTESELQAVYSFLIKVEGDCLRINGVVEDTVSRIQRESLNVKDGSQRKRKEFIMDKLEMNDLFKLYALASYTQILNCYVRSFIPYDLDSILRCLDDNEKRFKAFDQKFLEFRRGMRHVDLGKKHRKSLHDATQEKKDEIRELMKKVDPVRRETIQAIEKRQSYMEKPLELAIEIDQNGTIKSAERLDSIH